MIPGLEHVFYDELLFLTLAWTALTPWVLVFGTNVRPDGAGAAASRDLLRAQCIGIGLGIPCIVWFVWSLVGLIRIGEGQGFLW